MAELNGGGDLRCLTNQKEKHKVKRKWAGIPFLEMSLVDTTILSTINNYKCINV